MTAYIKPISIKKEYISEFEEWCAFQKEKGYSVSGAVLKLIVNDLKELKNEFRQEGATRDKKLS